MRFLGAHVLAGLVLFAAVPYSSSSGLDISSIGKILNIENIQSEGTKLLGDPDKLLTNGAGTPDLDSGLPDLVSILSLGSGSTSTLPSTNPTSWSEGSTQSPCAATCEAEINQRDKRLSKCTEQAWSEAKTLICGVYGTPVPPEILLQIAQGIAPSVPPACQEDPNPVDCAIGANYDYLKSAISVIPGGSDFFERVSDCAMGTHCPFPRVGFQE